MNHYVYEVTNLINGKKYIGKRSCKCPIEEDKYMGSGVAITRAIKKYGKENFKKDVLKICSTEDEAYAYEDIYTLKVKAWDNENYYNLKQGGRGGRTLISKSMRVKLKKPKTEEHRRKIGESNKGKNIGKIGKNNPVSKPVVMIDLEGNKVKEFECMREAGDYLDKPRGFNAISRVCRNGGTAYNYLWLFKDNYNNLINKNEFKEWYINSKKRYIERNRTKSQKNSKTIYQLHTYTLDIIQEFNSIKSASEITGISPRLIDNVCNHKGYTAGGYSWIYKDEYKTLSREELFKIYKSKYSKSKIKVICLNTLDVFDGVVDAIKHFNLCRGARIEAVCKGTKKSAGKHPHTNEPLRWSYYDDYINNKPA